MTTNRSSEELKMRELIVPVLRKRYPGARIIHELPVRYSTNRIDLAAVTRTEIFSVEIKSSKDVMDRLEAQLRAFTPISARIIVALAPKWNEKIPDEVVKTSNSITRTPQYTPTQQLIKRVSCGWTETWTVDAETGFIEMTDGQYGRSNCHPWQGEMLDMLHVAELVEIAARYRIALPKRPTHQVAVKECFDFLTGREVANAVCWSLRRRDAFDKASDVPIVEDLDGKLREIAPIPYKLEAML